MRRIGYSIGVWDEFHDGHRNHIRQALNQCDLLILGVVSDWLTMMQKGPERPSIPFAKRVEIILNEFPLVRIVEIDDLRMSTEIAQLIDLVFIGEDQRDRYYKRNMNPRWEVIEIPRLDGVSTTEIIRRQHDS